MLVSLAHSSLFDEAALADALTEGPLAAAWFDSLEPGALDPGRPLRHIDTLQVTPRVGGTTRSRASRSAWAVARPHRRAAAAAAAARADFRPTRPGGPADLEDGPAPA